MTFRVIRGETRVLELKHVFKGLIRVLELIRVLRSKHANWAAKSA